CVFATYNFDSIILTWVDFHVNRRSVPSWDGRVKIICQLGIKKCNLYKIRGIIIFCYYNRSII
ncbi:MAG: hypothetical protein ACLTXK_13015, partial [Megamonas funiformis]|uniref:hypothetical protein n=1 Tax=Megamonas funiformis TaxID=437897 RepID=UPI003995F093